MTTDTDTTFRTVPLTEFRPRTTLQEFIGTLRYRDRPGARQRFEADHQLLDRLHRELRAAAPWGPLGTVGELTEANVRGCVHEVADLHYGTWQLDGEEDEDIFSRLDRHFADAQRRWARCRVEEEERAAGQREASARFDAEIAERNDRVFRQTWGLPVAD